MIQRIKNYIFLGVTLFEKDPSLKNVTMIKFYQMNCITLLH
jgi:hypothetical protein